MASGAGVALPSDDEREHGVSTDIYARAKQIFQQAMALPPSERAAFVAQATSGIDQKEGKVLRAIGKSAGIAEKRVRSSSSRGRPATRSAVIPQRM